MKTRFLLHGLFPALLALIFIRPGWSQSEASAPPVIRLACVGDSITFGYGIKNRDQDSYPAQLAKLLGAGWEVRNFGVSGATMMKSGNKPYDKQKAYADLLEWKPDTAVIALGTNDSKPENIDAHKDDFVPSYRDLIAKLRQANAKVKIYVCLPVPVFPENWGIRETVMVSDIIPLTQQVAQETQSTLIDLHAALADKGALFADKVHPNAEGAGLIAKAVHQALAANPAPVSSP